MTDANIDKAIIDGLLTETSLPTQARVEPLAELKTRGFFTMAYPYIFINGSCDFTLANLHKLDYGKWVEHIYYNRDNRVCAHPSLKFLLLNIAMKKRALNQSNFCLKQGVNDTAITAAQLADKINEGDMSVLKRIFQISANLPNTNPFWRERKMEVEAMMYFLLIEFNTFPTYFDTQSCAEHKWKALHNILTKYLSETSNIPHEEIREKF